MPSIQTARKEPDFYGMNALARMIGKRPATTRHYVRTLYLRGTPGIFRADNGDYYCDRNGIKAVRAQSTAPGRQSLGSYIGE